MQSIHLRYIHYTNKPNTSYVMHICIMVKLKLTHCLSICRMYFQQPPTVPFVVVHITIIYYIQRNYNEIIIISL